VFFDGVFANEEAFPNLAIGQLLGQQVQHFDLPRCERFDQACVGRVGGRAVSGSNGKTGKQVLDKVLFGSG